MSNLILQSVDVGTVMSNCKPMETKIFVLLQGQSNLHDGEIAVNPTVVTKTNTSATGKVSTSEAMVDTTVEAEWLPSGSNRFTAPNVRVGEKVEIFKQGDEQIYYWRTLGLCEDKRKLETIILGISATPNEDDDSFDPSNRYWIEFSSHSKKIFLTTAKKNGEYCVYHMGFDTEEGTFQVVDEKGNEAKLNSQLDRWFITTALKCSIEMIGKDMNIKVPGNLDQQVVGNVSVKVGQNFTRTVGGNDTTTIQGKADYTAQGGFMFTGGGSKMWLNSSEFGWSAPKTAGGQ